MKHTNRPFQDYREMNEVLVKNWNRLVKRAYGAESKEIARMNLEAMLDSWNKYHAVIENWQMKWENLSTYFSYGPQLQIRGLLEY